MGRDTIVFRIDNVLAKEQKIVLIDYRHVEDREYIAFGQQFDNDCSEIDFDNKVKADL